MKESGVRSESPLSAGATAKTWKSVVASYQYSQTHRSIWQLCNTLIPFLVMWYLMACSLQISYWLTLALAIPTAGLVVRLFVLQHDCGHGSFFESRQANGIAGMMLSVLTLVPYLYWKKSHAIHHAHNGNLEHRGIGDVYTMTVNEYRAHSFWGKLAYRLYRHPVILFGISPTLLFAVIYRFPTSRAKTMRTVEYSVYWTDAAIACLVALMIWLMGWKAFLLVQAPITILSASMGTWLFYIQHQYEDAYWANDDTWDYAVAAMKGSSYYKLPAVLQWFTANIGFHHIHHLSPRIPNYLLPQCHAENPRFHEAVEITLRSSVKSLCLTLWDEERQRLISFRQFAKNSECVN